MTPTNEEILRGYKLIQTAMGITPDRAVRLLHEDRSSATTAFRDIDKWIEKGFYPSIQYHSAWSSLMPVIEKIMDEMDIDTYDEVFVRLYDFYAGNYQKGNKQTILDIWHSVVKYFDSKK